MTTAELKLREFSDQLASAAPTPGGGSASAVAGGLAAALVAMVGRLTLGKLEGEEHAAERGQMEQAVEQADRLRLELLELADRDAEAFEQVMAAYKLSKSTEEEKEKRRATLQEALKGATEVPFSIAEICGEVLRLAKTMADRGVRSAVSDAGTAASLAAASLHSALLNVDINLKYIKDEKFRRVYHKKREDLAHQAQVRRDAVLTIVEDWIRPPE
jgi:formiminotetrahydrofolate cyclodeaminase